MAVGSDGNTESHTGTTGSASEASFTWSHNPAAPRGVLVFVHTLSEVKKVTSVTYDGVSVPELTGLAAVATTGENGRVDVFFLGSSVPTTDPANVVVNRTNDATVMYAVSISVSAATDTEVYEAGAVIQTTLDTLAAVSVDDGSPGTNSLRFASVNSGLSSPPSAAAGSTRIPDAGIDFGARSCCTVAENTAGQGARNVGFSSGTAEDRAAVYLAVREVVAATFVPKAILI